MSRLLNPVTLALMPFALAACGDAARSTDPQLTTKAGAVANVAEDRRIQLMDACDPQSFNAALGAGTCARQGGVDFTKFLSLLGAHHSVGAWHMAPGTVNARVGQELLAVNMGGETHTFTEVEEFGGGIVPELNELSGNTTVAPECAALEADDFVPPGGTYTDDVEEAGTEKYQCCIHPWMRTVVTARE